MVSHWFHVLLVNLQWFPRGLGEANFANYAYKHENFPMILQVYSRFLFYEARQLLRWTIVWPFSALWLSFDSFFFFFLMNSPYIVCYKENDGKDKAYFQCLGHMPAPSLPPFSIQILYHISLTIVLWGHSALPSIRAARYFYTETFWNAYCNLFKIKSLFLTF